MKAETATLSGWSPKASLTINLVTYLKVFHALLNDILTCTTKDLYLSLGYSFLDVCRFIAT